MLRFFVLAAAILMAAPAYAAGSYGGGTMNLPPRSDDEFRQGLRLLKRERYEEAIPYLQEALRKKPRSADIRNYLGYAHRKLGNNEVSLAYYMSALEIDPDHRDAREYLGELYLQMDDLDGAKAQLAELERICRRGCDQREVLEAAIAAYVPPREEPAAPAPGEVQTVN